MIRSTAVLAVLTVLGVPATSSAQAWVPPAGIGSVTFVYQVIDNTGHLLTDGSLLPKGQSVSQAGYTELDYAFTDRLSASIGVPYVFVKYTGDEPPPAGLPGDLCHCWHRGWQDWGVSVRYNVLGGGKFALTPTFAAGVPSHAYAYEGEAVLGRRLSEVRVGVAAGQRLDALTDRLSIEATYSYAIVQQVLDLPNNRSNGTVEGVYAITRRLTSHGTLAWQRTHGGLRAGTGPPILPWGEINTPELFREHDRLLRDDYWRIGISASYSLSRFSLFGSVLEYVAGTDSHAGRAVTVGLGIPFEIDWNR